MDKCCKCHGAELTVTYEPEGAERGWYRPIHNVKKFMRDDGYFSSDKVKQEHLIWKCERCGYRWATKCKDSEVANG